MSKIEPFIFTDDEQEGFNLNPEQLPGAFEPQTEKEEETKSVSDEKEKSLESEPLEKDKEIDNKEESEDGSPFFKEEEKEIENTKVSAESVEFKALADYLIDTEVWSEFEGHKDFNYTEESFKEMMKLQIENKASSIVLEEKSQFGETAKELIDYLNSGGSIEEYTKHYTQQLEIEKIDTTTEEGQEEILKEYYKSLDYPESKIKRKIESLKDMGDEDFKEEAEFAKKKLVEVVEEERKSLIAEQEAIAKERKFRLESFNKAVRKEIYEDTLPEREKKELDKFIYEYKHQDQSGNKYSDFMVKMSEIQRDPKQYAKFLKIIKNFDSYQEPKNVEAKAKKEILTFLKKGTNSLEGFQSQDPIKQKVSKPKPFEF